MLENYIILQCYIDIGTLERMVYHNIVKALGQHCGNIILAIILESNVSFNVATTTFQHCIISRSSHNVVATMYNYINFNTAKMLWLHCLNSMWMLWASQSITSPQCHTNIVLPHHCRNMLRIGSVISHLKMKLKPIISTHGYKWWNNTMMT